MILQLLLGLIAVLIVWDYLHKKRRNDILDRSGIPGYRPLPVIGNALEMRGIDSERMIDFLRDSTQKLDKTFRFWMIHQLSVWATDPKDLEFVLSSQKLISKNSIYDMIHVWLGQGLLVSTGRKWHSRRKIITPTFHFKILEEFVDIFDQQSAVMVKKLSQFADGKTVINMFPIVCLQALDIIVETAMGTKINAQTNPNLAYVQAVTTVTNIIAERIRRPLQRVDWMFRLTAPREYKLMMDSVRTMHNFTENVIKERRATVEKSIAEKEMNGHERVDDDFEIGTKKRMALLDVLLQAKNYDGQPLTNEDIREEVDTFMFEGHDTTTSGISYALYNISRHPDVQQKLFEEIRDVLGDDKNHPVTLRELNELKYMECVIKESLRLFPPVPIIGRDITEDVEINGKIIPAGVNLTFPLFVTLRDPDYFTNPDAFMPERFSSDSPQKINPFANVPFSAGPRNCIGQKFAIAEMKSTISKVLRHFELLPLGPTVRPALNLIYRTVDGTNMGLKPRIYQ